MNTEKLLILVAACFASAGFSTGLSGLHAVSACSIGASFLALVLFIHKSNLAERKVWWLVAASTASTVMAIIAWKAPNNNEGIMALYGAPGALLVLVIWASGYAATRHHSTASS